jgi:hypothetical protein
MSDWEKLVVAFVVIGFAWESHRITARLDKIIELLAKGR